MGIYKLQFYMITCCKCKTEALFCVCAEALLLKEVDRTSFAIKIFMLVVCSCTMITEWKSKTENLYSSRQAKTLKQDFYCA